MQDTPLEPDPSPRGAGGLQSVGEILSGGDPSFLELIWTRAVANENDFRSARGMPELTEAECERARYGAFDLDSRVRELQALRPETNGHPDPADDPFSIWHLPLLGHGGWIRKGGRHLLLADHRLPLVDVLYECCRDWCAAGEAVLWITSRSKEDWQAHLERAGQFKGLTVVLAYSTTLRALRERADQAPATVLLLDDWRAVCQPVDDGEATCHELALPWLQTARARRLTFLLAAPKKGGILNGADRLLLNLHDATLRLTWGTGDAMWLHGAGRDLRPARRGHLLPADVPGGYAWEKDEEDELREAVLLATADGRWRNVDQVRRALACSPGDNLTSTLNDMARAGLLERAPEFQHNVREKVPCLFRQADRIR